MLRSYVDFFQRVCAANFAISVRCAGLSFKARALPPFGPPALPRATALAFFPCSSGVGSRSSTSPVAISTRSLPSWIGSRGRFRRRSAIRGRLHEEEIMIARAIPFEQLPTAKSTIEHPLFTTRRVPPLVTIGGAALTADDLLALFPGCHAGNMAWRAPIGNPAASARVRLLQFKLTHYRSLRTLTPRRRPASAR